MPQIQPVHRHARQRAACFHAANAVNGTGQRRAEVIGRYRLAASRQQQCQLCGKRFPAV